MNKSLQIQIVSPHEHCRLAQRLIETVQEVVQTLNFPASVELIFSFQEIMRLGVFRVPVLVVKGKARDLLEGG